MKQYTPAQLVEPLPPARKRPANECLESACEGLPMHAQGLCAMASFVREHTRHEGYLRGDHERRRLTMLRLHGKRWGHLVALNTPRTSKD